MSQEQNNVSFNTNTPPAIIFRKESTEIYKSIYLGQESVVKVLTLSDDQSVKLFLKEAKILRSCYFPHIVRYMNHSTQPPYEIVMEYCSNGSLWNVLHNKKFLPWYFIRWEIALDIGKGISYLHTVENIIHGDLKSPNVLLDKNYQAKICDFGSARKEGDTSQSRTLSTSEWAAPELFELTLPTKRSDVYSYGVILWEIASRKSPQEDTEVDPMSPYIETFPADCPSGYKKWATQCLSFDLNERPLITDVVKGLEEEKKLQIDHYYQSNIKKRFCFFSWNVSGEKAFQLGRTFRLNQSYKNAIHYLKKAVNINYLPAYLDLYLIYVYTAAQDRYIEREAGDIPMLVSDIEGKEYKNQVMVLFESFKKEAAKGSGEALYHLAKCYEHGLEGALKRNPEIAVGYYYLAAQKNYPVAQYDLAEYYLKRDDYLEGHRQDLKEAERYFILAANQGLALAQFRLGECYEQGLFGAKNKEKAMNFYHQAAEGGNLMALIKLGSIYEAENKQHPNMQSLEQALEMYTLASKEGLEKVVKKMMFLSELMKLQGEGVSDDFIDANRVRMKDDETLSLGPLTM